MSELDRNQDETSREIECSKPQRTKALKNRMMKNVSNEILKTDLPCPTTKNVIKQKSIGKPQNSPVNINLKIGKDNKQKQQQPTKSKHHEKIPHGIQGLTKAEEITLTRQANSWKTTISNQSDFALMKGTLDVYKWSLLCRKGLIKYEFYDPMVVRNDPEYEVLMINYIMNSPKGISCLRNELTVFLSGNLIGSVIATCFGFYIQDKDGTKIFKISKQGFFNICSNTTIYHIKKVDGEKIVADGQEKSLKEVSANTEEISSIRKSKPSTARGIIVIKKPDYPKKSTYTLKHNCDDINHVSLLVALLFRMLADSLMSF